MASLQFAVDDSTLAGSAVGFGVAGDDTSNCGFLLRVDVQPMNLNEYAQCRASDLTLGGYIGAIQWREVRPPQNCVPDLVQFRFGWRARSGIAPVSRQDANDDFWCFPFIIGICIVLVETAFLYKHDGVGKTKRYEVLLFQRLFHLRWLSFAYGRIDRGIRVSIPEYWLAPKFA